MVAAGVALEQIRDSTQVLTLTYTYNCYVDRAGLFITV